MALPSPQQHNFAVVPSVQTTRTRFKRDSEWHGTFDGGWLIPFYLDEVIPGDSMKIHATCFGRFATLLKPLMDNVYVDFHFFFVPNRLVWDNWVKLQGERDNPDDDIDYSVPEMTAPASTGYAVGSLYDNFGLPVGVPLFKHSALPLRMYNLIWNNWYRPQDICDSVVVDKGDADSDPTNYVLLKRAKRHDYFTAGLPYPQKGDDVLLPLGEAAPVLTSTSAQISGAHTALLFVNTAGSTPAARMAQVSATGQFQTNTTAAGTANEGLVPQNLYADLSDATAATMNALREAAQTQRLLERDARSGTRYPEILRGQYGVTDPSFSVLQRPVYLGGGTSRLNVNPIQQNSASGATGTTTKLGDLAGMGTISGTHGFVKSFTEHGYVIGILSARVDLNYQQGLERHWSKLTRYDFYLPVFANLGEQAVLTKELYCQAPSVDTGSTGTPDNEKIFSYMPRYDEYRYKPSKITGLFRSGVSGSLDVWHSAQQFTSLPTLSPTFILENPPFDRNIAVTTEPHFLMDVYIANESTRILPAYSVPGLIDHL